MAPTTDGSRPQDVGRSHSRRGRPSPATSSLLTDYQAAMRAELRGLLVELEGRMPEPGLVPDPDPKPVRPSLGDRTKLWDLAIKLGRELGSEVDDGPAPGATAPSPRGPRRRSGVDFGGA